LNNSSQSSAIPLVISPTILGHIFLGACLFFGSSAQLTLKFAMLQISAHPNDWVSYTWIICGLVVYTLGTGFWMLSLGYLDLSYAYPFTGLTYALVLGVSWGIFHENISWQRIFGVLLICAGVALIPGGTRREA
jgi:multidrug transporter EmrE-like cation transporter